MKYALAAVIGLTACRPAFDLADREDIFALPGDRGVMCAADMEWPHVDLHVIQGALHRAQHDHQIVQLFAHDPGVTVSVDKLEQVLFEADSRQLTWFTYADLAGGVPRERGIALSFDDFYVEHWHDLRDLLRRYGARVTFFVSDYDVMTAEQRAMLADLAADGHDIEYHSTRHQDARAYSRDHGVAGWLADDIDPALAAMRADGWNPIVFAYPSGHRTAATDAAMLGQEHFALLRGVMRECPPSAHETRADLEQELDDDGGDVNQTE